jgi:hypothetical protein
VLAEAPRPQVADPDLGQAALLDARRDAVAEWALEHRREERQDVDLERHGCGGAASSTAGADLVAAVPSSVGAGVSVVVRRARRRGAFGRSGSGAFDRRSGRAIGVDDDLAATRRRLDERADHWQVDGATVPPSTTSTSFPPAR